MSQDVWVVLYTHQKTNKQKKYKDGILKYNPSNQKAILCDESGKTIESKFVGNMYLYKLFHNKNKSMLMQTRTIEAGAELEFDGNLIQVEELKSSGTGTEETSASQATKPTQQTQTTTKATQPTTTKTTAQNSLRRPALRPKLGKRTITPAVEEKENEAENDNDDEEEEIVPVRKAARPNVQKPNVQKPTPLSSYEDEDDERLDSQSAMSSSDNVPSSGRDSDAIMAMLFGDDAPDQPTPAPKSTKSNTITKTTTKSINPKPPPPQSDSDGELAELSPPSLKNSSTSKNSSSSVASHPAPASLPVPKRRRVGLQKSGVKTKNEEIEREEEDEEIETGNYGGEEQEEDDMDLSALFAKKNSSSKSSSSISSTTSSYAASKNSTSSNLTKPSITKPKLAAKGFKVPVSKVEQKKAVLFQHDRISFPDPELCEGLLKQGSAPVRQIAIPNLFEDLSHYTSTFTRAITEDINLQLVDLSKKVYQNFAELYRKSDKTGSTDGPKCPHGPARLIETKKEGKNKGKEFYSCATRNKNCKFFKWADEVDDKTKQRSSLKQRVANYTLDKAHEPALHKAGVYMYIDCELIAKKDEPVDFFTKRNNPKESEPEKKSDKPPILYLKLSEKREPSTSFSKDDLWLISTDPKFSGDGLFFFAKSVFHSPGRSGLLEIKPIEEYPKLPGASQVYALHAVNVATELSMIECLSNLSFPTLPILPYLIWGKDPDKNKNYQTIKSSLSLPDSSSSSSSSTTPATQNSIANNSVSSPDPFMLNLSEKEADKIAYEVIETYKLNIDQERVLRSVMEWFQFTEDNEDKTNNINPDDSGNDDDDLEYTMGASDEDDEDAEFLQNFLGKKKDNKKKSNKDMGVEIKTRSDGSPIVLVHGVFGSGKSYLIVILIIYLSRILSEARNEQVRILVSAVTNVAVDRILLGLVAQGFTQFIRVGSLKKIAKPILPFTLHESRKNAKSDFDEDREALKDLNDMMHHDNLSKEDMKYVLEMIASIKQGANKNKKKELKSMRVIGVTCVASAFSILEGNCFPIVFLDECSQMLEPLSLLPISRFGCSKLLAVGDPMQLPPTLRNGSSNENTKKGESGLEKTLFLRLVFLGFTPIMLRTQYRCHPMLSGIVNTLFYNNRLIDGVKENEREPLVPAMPVLMLCDSENGKEKADKGGSYMNEWEAHVVVKLVQKLLSRGIDGSVIGVICLYKAQLKKVQELLRVALGKNKPKTNSNQNNNNNDLEQQKNSKFQIQDTDFDPDDFFDDSWMQKKKDNKDDEEEDKEEEGKETETDTENTHKSDIGKISEGGENEENENNDVNDEVQVSTVDAFQGAEKEIIILTCSRTDRLGFSDSPHRLNVAITRAKRHLFIVGQQKLMITSDIWKHVIHQAKKSPYGIQKSEAIVYSKDFAFEKNK